MQDTLTVIFCAFVAIYLLQTLLVFIGTIRLDYQRTQKLQMISVLVALRDEQDSVADCVTSLLRQDYPPELLEIILVNDRSRDRTPEIIRSFALESEHIKTIDIQHGIPGLSGKANAIAQAMAYCRGDLILVTDGDCRVPESWARAHASYYADDVGLVGGFTLLDQPRDRTSLFGRVQSLDWAYLLSIGSGAIGLGKPLSVLGNNFSFRKSAYEEVGGYRKMGFTIIEDFALMRTLVQQTAWQVRYPISPDMLVTSLPMKTVSAFYQQRKRWSAGGKEVGWYGKFLMSVAMLVHLGIPLTLLTDIWQGAIGLLVVLGADFCLLWRTTGMANRRDLLRQFPLWEGFYFLYTAFFAPVLLLPTTVTWKQISYSWKLNWKLRRMWEPSD